MTDEMLETVLQGIAAEPAVWVRLAAVRSQDGDRWTQLALDLTTGEAPPGFRSLRWQYPSALLLAERRPGDVVARWLRSGHWQCGRLRVPLGPLTEGQFRWDRRASNETDFGGEPLRWPSLGTSLMNQGNVQVPSDALVGAGLPTFLSLHVAVAHLLNVAEPRGGGFTTQTSRLRMQNLRGRIVRVRLHSDHVEVLVDGPALRGLTCELAGQAPGPAVALRRSGAQRVQLPLDEQLAPESWVVLRNDVSWLDRRFLNVNWVARDSDVEIVLEPRNRLESLVGGHEGPDVEFKRELPQDNENDKHTLMKTVGAFANGNGGTIVFGVSDDERAIGLPLATLRKQIDRLVDLVEGWIEPHPMVSFDTIDLEGSTDVVLLMSVAAGMDTPYCVGLPSKGRHVYARRHGHTRPANQREQRAIVERTVPREAAPRFP